MNPIIAPFSFLEALTIASAVAAAIIPLGFAAYISPRRFSLDISASTSLIIALDSSLALILSAISCISKPYCLTQDSSSKLFITLTTSFLYFWTVLNEILLDVIKSAIQVETLLVNSIFNWPPTTSSTLTSSLGIEPKTLVIKIVGSTTLNEYSPKKVISTLP